MMIMIFAALVMIGGVMGFNQIYSLKGIEKCYFGLYKGIVERCVFVGNSQGEYRPIPHFYLPRLNEDLAVYFANNLGPYCDSYGFATVCREKNAYGGCMEVAITYYAKPHIGERRNFEAVFSISRSLYHG